MARSLVPCIINSSAKHPLHRTAAPPPPVRQAAAPASKLPFPAPPLRATAPAPNCPTLLPHSEQLHLVLVDLNAAKDTTSILRSLQAAYPKPSGVSECACMCECVCACVCVYVCMLLCACVHV